MIGKHIDGTGDSLDRTIPIPRPGGGRRRASRPSVRAVVGATPSNRRSPPEASSADAGPLRAHPSSASRPSLKNPWHTLNAALSAAEDNPILQAAVPLLTFAVRIQTAASLGDVQALRQGALRKMHSFRERLLDLKVRAEDIRAASYALCTFVDAAALNTSWATQSGWSTQPLLAYFHRDSVGDAQFFQILERLRSNPARYTDLIELFGVCLSLGYEGKYRLDEQGPAKLTELYREVSNLIRDYRARRPDGSSSRAGRAARARRRFSWFALRWLAAASAVLLLVGGSIWVRSPLLASLAPGKTAPPQLASKLNNIAPRRPQGARLHRLLEPLERAGLVTVDDQGDKTVVTLTAADLFPSGSASVNPTHYRTLREIAAALNVVPGRVMLVDHTDDQAPRPFPQDFELSYQRALAVAEVLRPAIHDFSRIKCSGVAASQPRYLPASTPSNWVRNRLEVILVNPEPST